MHHNAKRYPFHSLWSLVQIKYNTWRLLKATRAMLKANVSIADKDYQERIYKGCYDIIEATQRIDGKK